MHPLPRIALSLHEIKQAFSSLKTNKSVGFDKISFNVVKKSFLELNNLIKHILKLSLLKGIFLEK